MRRLRLTFEKRRVLHGYIFVLPFIIGTIIFFAFPLYISLRLSFGQVVKFQGFVIEGVGFENFKRAFILDINFLPIFYEIMIQTITNAPLIIIFSLFIAILINKSMKGRGIFRLVFFLPFLLGSGEVMSHLLAQQIDQQVLSIADGTLIPREVFTYLGKGVVDTIDLFFGTIVKVMWGSCVQILIFLSGIQSIPVSLYEASKVEGATEWDSFWKITLPMILPVMLLNIIYTFVDLSLKSDNFLLEYVKDYAFNRLQFGYASAMGWIYFVFILLVISIIMYSFSRGINKSIGQRRK
jgi:ABC-type sugar transport system permease subunit